MIIAFVLNRKFVFRHSTNKLKKQIGYFTAINILAVAQTLIISLAFSKYILYYFGIKSHVKEVAHAIGIVVPIFSSFIGHKHLTFTKHESLKSSNGKLTDS